MKKTRPLSLLLLLFLTCALLLPTRPPLDVLTKITPSFIFAMDSRLIK